MFAIAALIWILASLAVFVALASVLDMVLEARGRIGRTHPNARASGFRRQ